MLVVAFGSHRYRRSTRSSSKTRRTSPPRHPCRAPRRNSPPKPVRTGGKCQPRCPHHTSTDHVEGGGQKQQRKVRLILAGACPEQKKELAKTEELLRERTGGGKKTHYDTFRRTPRALDRQIGQRAAEPFATQRNRGIRFRLVSLS